MNNILNDENNILQKIRTLPMRQQIALWVILRFPDADNEKFIFKSSELANRFDKFASDKIKKDKSEYGRFIGGILSGLSRNRILIKLSGDRDKSWTLVDEIKDNFDNYKKSLLEVKIYWE